MGTRALHVSLLAAAVGAAGLAGGAPAAALRPEVVAALGRTVAVEGDPGGGGMSLALSFLWPLEERFRVGVMAFAEDLGERTDRLVGPGGADLGPVATLHRAARGGAWRMEGQLPGGSIEPYLAATWGFYSVGDDVRGTALRKGYAAGFGLGFGVQHPVSQRHAAGVGLRFQQLSRGASERYMSAALEWRWGRAATE